MSGTELVYAATPGCGACRYQVRLQVSGTGIAYWDSMVLRSVCVCCYAMCGTEPAYGATQRDLPQQAPHRVQVRREGAAGRCEPALAFPRRRSGTDTDTDTDTDSRHVQRQRETQIETQTQTQDRCRDRDRDMSGADTDTDRDRDECVCWERKTRNSLETDTHTDMQRHLQTQTCRDTGRHRH
eukprot:3941746-Rhodomonas_salina.3